MLFFFLNRERASTSFLFRFSFQRGKEEQRERVLMRDKEIVLMGDRERKRGKERQRQRRFVRERERGRESVFCFFLEKKNRKETHQFITRSFFPLYILYCLEQRGDDGGGGERNWDRNKKTRKQEHSQGEECSSLLLLFSLLLRVLFFPPRHGRRRSGSDAAAARAEFRKRHWPLRQGTRELLQRRRRVRASQRRGAG